jgi:glutamate--cysteine ligase
VDAQLEQRLAGLGDADAAALLGGLRRGIEKESLRITPAGRLAQTPHPTALGSALTHPCITTDYSEALLEFITAPGAEIPGVLAELDAIHRFVYHHIDGELLWTSSMPCVLEAEHEVPVAQYGSSNVARMKTTYRVGLGHRYGRLMQTIAGIHYNFSIDDASWEWLRARAGATASLRDFKTAQYFALIRNFHRYSWLLVYLFGASPALCRSFVGGRDVQGLEPLSGGTLHAPFGTSLRMGDLGYQSDAQRSIDVPYNGLDDYLDALSRAITEPHPAYAAIGTRRDGEWLQLSTSLLQIENEFYATIRPKRVTQSGEAPRHALRERGVEYIEVRCLDIDPFEPSGINADTARFVDAFLLYCLLHESPLSDAEARTRSRANLRQVVNRGREPGLELRDAQDRPVALRDWGLAIVADIARIGARLDAAGSGAYARSIALQQHKLEDPAQTPSARVLRELEQCERSFYRFAMACSERHRAHYLAVAPDAADRERFERWARESLAEQRAIEQSDTLSFEDYLAAYFRQ